MIIGRKDLKHYYDIRYDVNYYNVRNNAWDFLIKNKVVSYPLDLHQIVKNNYWTLISYNNYAKLTNQTREDLLKISTDGFVETDPNQNYCIVINEKNSEHRCRFTTAHEIGHIILHKVFKNEKRLEKEANMFASRILMPMLLIKELEIKTPEELSYICNVSLESAKYRLKRYNEIYDRNSFYTNPNEKLLLDNLKNFILNYRKKENR